ncbi:hypothetical protein [Glaciecola sp. 1036]|uniref:hypothetical protein n=1 Tax=Alteromonadaceae TaxID=72275 RepID=UPI003D021F7A
MSGSNGFFLINSQTVYSDASVDTLIKSGICDEKRRIVSPLYAPNFSILTDSEKFSCLSFIHELKHFFDLTSIHSGIFYWRLGYVMYELYNTPFRLASELGILTEMTFPAQEWFIKSAKTLIKKKIESAGEIFGMSIKNEDIEHAYNFYVRDNIKLANNLRYFFDIILNDPFPTPLKRIEKKSYLKIINESYKTIIEYFAKANESPLRMNHFNYLPEVKWVAGNKPEKISKNLFLSFNEIFELRAYFTEYSNICNNSSIFEEVWIDRLTKIKISNNLRFIISKLISLKIDKFQVLFITDIALSGTFEINSLVKTEANGVETLKFYDTWPSYRLAKLLNIIFENKTMLDNDWLFETACYCFGRDWLGYNGFFLRFREIIPRYLRDPDRISKMTDFVNYKTPPLIRAFFPENIWKKDIWDDKNHVDSINSSFRKNSYSYYISFHEVESKIGYSLPSTIFLSDTTISNSIPHPTAANPSEQWERNLKNIKVASLFKSVIHPQILHKLFTTSSVPRVMLHQYISSFDEDTLTFLIETLNDVYTLGLTQSMFPDLPT